MTFYILQVIGLSGFEERVTCHIFSNVRPSRSSGVSGFEARENQGYRRIQIVSAPEIPKHRE